MTENKPLLSVTLPNFGGLFPAGEWRGYLDLARAADEEGIDRITVVDHVVMGVHTENYTWGPFPSRSDVPWLEPLTVLAAIAAVTSRVRLATSILIAPLRGPAVVAKTVATLDVLSGGRVDLGVGPGWQREEYDANGSDWERRGQVLTDTIAACKALWQNVPADFDSPTVSFRDIYCLPQPLQPGGVPIWVGGDLHRANMERITRWGDGWIPIMNETFDGMAVKVKRIKEAWQRQGRDPEQLKVQWGLSPVRDAEGKLDLSRTLAAAPEAVAAGATVLGVPFAPAGPGLDEARRFFRDAARGFAAEVGR